MAYDIKNAKETKLEPLLEPDTIVDGVIVEIKDGKVKDFVTEERLKKWDSDPESECIELSVEVKCERAENGFIKIHKLLTYKTVNNIQITATWLNTKISMVNFQKLEIKLK